MSTFADNNKTFGSRSSSKLNNTTGSIGRRIVYKEKIQFPVKDPRLSRSAGICFVDKDDVLEDMLDDDALYRTRAIREGLMNSRNGSISDRSHRNSSDNALSRQPTGEHRARDALQVEQGAKKSLQKQIQNNQQKKDILYSNLVDDIAESMTLLDSIDKNMSLMEETKRSKSRRQFEEWNTQVHGSIQMDISKQINLMDSKKLNKKKNEDYDKFLDISNRKSAIFRDIIIESEYDPLEPNRRAIRAKTMKLIDPTKLDAQKAEEEGSMLNGKKMKQKLGKDTLNVELWATGKIEATPYGVSMKMMDAAAVPGSLRSQTLLSNVKFDHFEYPKGNECVQAEMPKGKRTQPLSSVSDTSKRIFGRVR